MRQAEKILAERYHIKIKIIDLRLLKPINKYMLIAAANDCKNILIVDEGQKTGSVSEELITLLVEELKLLPKIKRLIGKDSFIPIGDAWQYVLPSQDDIVSTVVAMVQDEVE